MSKPAIQNILTPAISYLDHVRWCISQADGATKKEAVRQLTEAWFNLAFAIEEISGKLPTVEARRPTR